jgi:hypothetical protein
MTCSATFVPTSNSAGKYCSRKCYHASKIGEPSNRRATPEKFWVRVAPKDENGCRIWTGSIHHSGYGVVDYHGRQWLAHRLSFFLSTGQQPEAVCHRCDNPPCCNPDHLWAGTYLENNRDREAKGRGRYAKVRLHAASGDNELAHEVIREQVYR